MGKKEGEAEGRTLSVRDCNERGSSVLSPRSYTLPPRAGPGKVIKYTNICSN